VNDTKLNFINIAKAYLVILGFISGYYFATYVFGFIAVPSNAVFVEPSFSYLHLGLSAFYMSFPMIAVYANNYKIYTIMLGIAASRIIVAMSGILSWEINIAPIPVALYVIASFLCLLLAIENVSSQVTVEALSLSSLVGLTFRHSSTSHKHPFSPLE
jgi:hypothetical protein